MEQLLELLFGKVLAVLQTLVSKAEESIQIQRESLEVQKQILKEVGPRPPVAMTITISANPNPNLGVEENMARLKGKLKITFNSDGSATATLGFVDDTGMVTSLPSGATFAAPWVSSDPGLVATPSTDQLSAKLTVAPGQKTPVSGATVAAGPGQVTNADGSAGATLPAVTSETVNIVAGGPAGMTIVLA